MDEPRNFRASPTPEKKLQTYHPRLDNWIDLQGVKIDPMKQKFLVVFILACTLCSCGEDPKKENQNNLIGTWIAVQRTYAGCENELDNGVDDLDCTNANCLKMFFEKDSLGSFYSIETTIDGITSGESGTFRAGEKNLTLCLQVDEDTEICESLKMDVSKTMLSLTRTDTSLACTVTTLFQAETL